MKDCCLISTRQLCDEGFSVNFNTNNVFLQKVNGFITSYSDATTGIYLLYFDHPQPLPSISNYDLLPPPKPSPSTSNTLAKSVHGMSTKRGLVVYLHQDAWIPVPSTYIQEIEAGIYATGPGLTPALVCKNPPKRIHAAKGNICQEQKKPHSKNKNHPDIMTTPEELEIPSTRAYLAHFKIVETSGKISSDQTGCLLVTSSLGCKCIMVLHDSHVYPFLSLYHDVLLCCCSKAMYLRVEILDILGYLSCNIYWYL